MGGAEVQADPGRVDIGAFAHPAADLDQAQAQRIELQGSDLGDGQTAAQVVQQPVRRGGEQEPEGVRPEPMVAQPVGMQSVLEVFDPVLRLAPVDVPVVQRQRGVGPGRDHKARVRPLEQDLALNTTRRGPGQLSA
jgi:hypothetical protein